MENISQYLLNLSEQKYILLGLIVSLSFLSYILMRYVVIKAIFHLFEKTSTKLDDILIERGRITKISKRISNPNNYKEIKLDNLHVSQGWFDSSVSFGEPGFEDREIFGILVNAETDRM